SGRAGLVRAVLPCVDDRNFPAVLSDRLSTGLLRDELGFDGVLVSDALIMSGFVSYRTYEKRMIAMVNAGIDVMLWPEENIFDLVEKAVSWGDIPVERIDEAARRVLEMKFASGVMDKSPLPDDLPEEEYASVSNRIAEKGTVLVMDRNNVLPLKQGEVKKALVVISDLPDKLAAMAKPEEDKRFVHIFKGLRERGVSDIEIKLGGNCLDLLDAELKGARYDAVIYIFAEAQPYAIRPSVATMELVWQMSNTIVHNAVAISLYTPYISKENPITPAAVINACSSCPASQRAAVKLMFGEIPFQGKSSVDIGVDYHSIGEWDKIEYKSLAKEN
ncbi:MAG: hypothetical protein MJ025_05900, partial [Victivallaceae bacterium]|nr:hypothetical protein [Victivallaceae bacterium]